MRSVNRIPGVLALGVAVMLVGACNRGPDPKDRVEQNLKQANIEHVNVDYDRDARVVHLKGAVDSTAEKERAEQVAHEAVGTTGKVANELTVKGVDQRTADDMDGAIRKELNAKVDNDRALEGRDVNFDVNNGVVTIKGEVRSAAEKDQVGQMARATANVKEVVNSLELNPKVGTSKANRAADRVTPDHSRTDKNAPAR
ncbi:MAG TPA: BON domain-containing protein [Vicinamibacterales bacterium]|jgi:osmotically-inducible protein OsmY